MAKEKDKTPQTGVGRTGAAVGEREAFREQVIHRHLALANRLADRYAGRGIPSDDLRQVAAMGLVKAANGYDPRRGGHFIGYAVPTIKGELRRHFRDQGWAVRPPRRLQELQARLSAAEGELSQALRRRPTESELADWTGARVADVRESRAMGGCFIPQSTDADAGSGGPGLRETLGGGDPAMERVETRMLVAEALSLLDGRDRAIIQMRYGEELSQDQIGRRIGVTQMQVSRLLRRILDSLRARLAEAA